MLTTLLAPRTTAPRPAAAPLRHAGPIGIDIGSRTLKWARLAPVGGGWQLTEAHILPLAESQTVTPQSVLDGAVREALRATNVQPRTAQPAACTLTMALTDLRTLELPTGTADELRQMAYHEVADGLGEASVELALWSMPRVDNESENTQVTTVALPTKTALAIAHDLRAQRLTCRCLTALPYALARAVLMADPASRTAATAILDWGVTSPSLTIVRNGQPVFSRLLRDCGANRVAEALAESLQLSADDIWQLLSLTGDAATRSHAAPLREAVRGSVRPLLQQLERSFSYVRSQYPDLVPRRLWVAGIGGLLQPAFPELAAALGLEVQPWRLSATECDPMQSVLAAAIGMAGLGRLA